MSTMEQKKTISILKFDSALGFIAGINQLIII